MHHITTMDPRLRGDGTAIHHLNPMFTRAANILTAIPPRRLAFFLFALMLVRTGIWGMGSFNEQLAIAVAPFTNSFPHAAQSQYLYSSYLNPNIAHFFFEALQLPQSALVPFFFAYNLLWALAGTALFCWLVINRLPENSARTSLLIFFLFPISGTAYFWVGMDGLTFLLMLAPFLFPQSLLWVGGCGILLGLQHFEQGAVGYAALLASLLLAHNEKESVPVNKHFAAATLGGVLLGKLLLAYWFASLDLHVAGRADLMLRFLDTMVGYVLLHPFITFASLFGAGWLAIGKMADLPACARRAFFIPLLLLLPFVFVGEDETRVLAFITFPLLLAWLLLNPRTLALFDKNFLGFLAVCLIVIPWLWVWRGEPRWSAFPYDLAYISHAFFGWPSLPDDLFSWVFHWRFDKS